MLNQFSDSRHEYRFHHGNVLTNKSSQFNRLVGLVVKTSASRAADPEFDSRWCGGDFSGSSHTSDLTIDTPVATLPGAWRCRVSAGTGWPVSIYCDWMSWKVWCATSVSVWQQVNLSEQIRPWDTLACCWDVMQPTDKQTSQCFQSYSLHNCSSKPCAKVQTFFVFCFSPEECPYCFDPLELFRVTSAWRMSSHETAWVAWWWGVCFQSWRSGDWTAVTVVEPQQSLKKKKKKKKKRCWSGCFGRRLTLHQHR